MKKKEKLFKKQDVSAWRVVDQDRAAAERVKNDPNLAMQFILPEVNSNLQ